MHGAHACAASGSIGRRDADEAVGAHLEQDAGEQHGAAVGASTCASGSHVCSGKIGTFTAKPRKNARKTHIWKP